MLTLLWTVRVWLLIAGASWLAGCASGLSNSPTPAIIEDYVQAYNDRDVDQMAVLMYPDIQWLSVEGEDLVVFADGKTDLVQQMSDYLASPQVTTSTLSSAAKNGAFISVVETARWKRDDGQEAEQSAIAVYEIRDNLIRRVWYYPAE